MIYDNMFYLQVKCLNLYNHMVLTKLDLYRFNILNNIVYFKL